MSKSTLITYLFILFAVKSYAQQETQFTQYMFNRLVINPAYAGSHESLSLTSLYRSQWAGLEGAPETLTFSAHSPLRNKSLGLGLIVVKDKIGVHEQLNVATSYSYKMPVSDKASLSFGLQAGFSTKSDQYSTITNFSSLGNDPAFSNGDGSITTPEFGAGIFYQSEKFYAGISSPKLSGKTFSKEIAENDKHFFLNAGYVFNLNNIIKIHPSALVKMVENAPIGFDLNTTMIFNDVLWTGISYRSKSSFSFLAQLQVTPQIRFGYAYDSAPYRNFSQSVGGSHEIMLNYQFVFFKSKVVTPRYF